MIDFIKKLFPYKFFGENNKLYIVQNGQKKECKKQIKGLELNIRGDNNTITIHYPFTFINTEIEMEGNNCKFEIESSDRPMKDTYFFIDNAGEVYIGKNSRFNTGNIKIFVGDNPYNNPSKLIVGNDFQVGRNVTIRTSDGHAIFNKGEDLPYNAPQTIKIGDYVWLGTNVMVTKGAEISSNTVVGAYTLVNKKFTQEGIILGGIPAKILKENIYWYHRDYGQIINKKDNLIFDDIPKYKIKRVMIKKLKSKLKRLLPKSFC